MNLFSKCDEYLVFETQGTLHWQIQKAKMCQAVTGTEMVIMLNH